MQCFLLVVALWTVPAAVHAGPLHVYTEPGRPLEYDENGDLIGLTAELVREVMQRAGIDAEIKAVPWKRGYQEVEQDPDAAIFPVYRTPEREGLFLWSDPILKAKWVLFKRKGSTLSLQGLEDARHVGRIAVPGADARLLFMKGLGFTNLEVVPLDIFGWRMLVQGRVDLVAGSNLARAVTSEEYAILVKQVEPALTLGEFTLHVAFSSGADPQVVLACNKALRGMVRDGTYAALYHRYFQTDEYSPYPLPPLN